MTDTGPPPARAWFAVYKPLVERCLAAVLLLLAAPVIALAALLVRLTSAGPAIYRQTRTGRRGRPFTIYKLRTMTADSEKDGARWALPKDPRVTRVGALLRRTHVDELPQLWNVLKGDMSLVGPRPERPEFIPGLSAAIPRYAHRLAVLPGMTGLAQVQLPADTDVESVRRKLGYDLYYIENGGAWLDLRLLLATALKVVGVAPGGLAWVFGLPRYSEVALGAAAPQPAAPAMYPAPAPAAELAAVDARHAASLYPPGAR